MKTEKQLNEDIIKITAIITNDYPEMVKYMNEIPVKMTYKGTNDISIKQLAEYYNSLEAILKKYSVNHNGLKN